MTIMNNIQSIFVSILKLPLWILAVLLKISLVAAVLYRWNFPLSQIPGPKSAAWTRFWWIRTLRNGDTSEELVRLDKDYGSIVRLTPNSVLVSDPDITRRILAAGSLYKRGPWFDSLRLDPDISNVAAERDQQKHQHLRSILSTGLSGRDIDMQTTIDDHVREWIGKLDERSMSAAGHTLQQDLSSSLPLLTLDIITHLCLGKPFQSLANGQDPYGFLSALHKGAMAQQYIASLLELKSLLFFLGRSSFFRSCFFPNMKNRTGIGRVMMVIHRAVERKLENDGKPDGVGRDMLESFISRGLTIGQASHELVIVLTSGVVSTSYSAQAIIRCIIANRAVCYRLQEEIDNVVASTQPGKFCFVDDTIINQMPYFQACKSEGLRMYPPIFHLREREVPAEGDIMHGYHIPGGTFVGLNSLATQLHPLYGDNRDEFHPERWLITDEAQLKEMHRNLELVFGYGASKCLGVNIAHMELNKILFEFFRHYEASLVNPEVPWIGRGDFVLSGFDVNLKRREF